MILKTMPQFSIQQYLRSILIFKIYWHNFQSSIEKFRIMNKLFRGLIAGYGAKKLGGGCFSMILIFFLIYWLLGYCN